ncbi:MAG: twin-arginine translocase TatA/TatE family subunit [Planctomyces sp.]|jgi:sec-independent protein translocase protein TatA
MMNLSDLTNVLAIGMPGLSEMVIVLVVVLLLFGNRLPGAMKSLGQSFTAFKKGIKEGEDDQGDDRNIGQK